MKSILQNKNHRPWELPDHRWRYYQEWNNVIFMHWKVDEYLLRSFVPKELEIDLFEGEAWVSIVAFTMEKIRPRILPAFPPISNFDEVNIRTYIKKGDKTGVYFLSVEGGKSLSCKLSKALSQLPYRYSKMKRTPNRYEVANSEYGDHLEFEFEIGKSLKQVSELDNWLTERYALFQDASIYMNKFELHHLPWKLQPVSLKNLQYKYDRFHSLFNGEPLKAHYSEGVRVLAWDKERI